MEKYAELGWEIFKAISPLLLAALTWLSVKASGWVKAKTNNTTIGGMLGRATTLAFTVVKEAQQVFVKQMKDDSKDGVWTDVEKAKAKKMAMDSLKSHLGMKGLKELGQVLGLNGEGIEGFLSSQIESAVHDIKKIGDAKPVDPS